MSTGFSGHRHGWRAILRQTTTVTRIMGDIDGDKRADFAIRLDGIHTLIEGNFVL